MSKSIIASTIGLELSELEDYRYQPTKLARAVYSIGDDCYCCSKKNPGTLNGMEWHPAADQFWASRKNTVLWKSTAQSE